MRRLAYASLIMLLPCAAGAETTINVGNHFLLENTPGQVISILVSGTDLVSDFNLNAQIGDGYGGANPEPIFTAVSFAGTILVPTIWDAHPFNVTDGGLWGLGANMDAAFGVGFVTSGHTTLANGLLVKLTIDTTGFGAGQTFPLLLGGASSELGDSYFLAPGPTTINPVISNGSITLTAVPEPSSIAMLASGLLCVGALVYVRHRRNRTARPAAEAR